MKKKISVTIDSDVLNEVKLLIDGIKIRNMSQAIESLIRKSTSERRVAVILAGGDEDKLKFNGVLKPLVKFKGKTVIERMIENFRRYNFLDIFLVGRKNTLSEIFKSLGDGSGFGINLNYVEEKVGKSATTQDSARTLKLLKDKVKTTFICSYCDILFNYNLDVVWNFHKGNSAVVTNLLKTTQTPAKWGVVTMNGNQIEKFSEKPNKTNSNLIYTGIFISHPDIFNMPGNSLEYDVFPKMANMGRLAGFICSGSSGHIHEKNLKYPVTIK
ncbi:MAG: sugar phosphate nucleotidyltransferase [Candidatus Aenigmatarchaeota archaeon]